MKPYKAQAHIHSLDGDMREIMVLRQDDMFGQPIPNAYIVDFGGVKCTAVFNLITCQYYADDKYGIVKES